MNRSPINSVAPPSSRPAPLPVARAWFAYLSVVLALAFVLYQWIYSGGFPYIRDGNETATSFVHALNLEYFNPVSTSFLTTYDTEFNKTAINSTLVYTHNPNFPRYVHYLLLKLGIKSFTTQILHITFSMTLLNMVALRRLFQTLLGRRPCADWLTLAALFATSFDYLGFLSFTVNTYRTYTFSLLWLGLLAMVRPWRFWPVFVIFFALFQLEYGFGLFVLASAFALWLIVPRPSQLRTLLAMGSGTAASLICYFLQLRSYESLSQIMADFMATSQRRGGGHVAGYFSGTLTTLLHRLQEINGPTQNVMLLWALVTALISVVIGRFRRAHLHAEFVIVRSLLARLYLALIFGAFVASLLMTNYFIEAFFGSILPLLTFFNVTATALVVADLLLLLPLLPRRWPHARPTLAVLLVGLALVPMLQNSLRWWRDYPGLTGGYVDVLKKHYLGKPILVMGHFIQLPTALTRGPALQMTDADPTVDQADFSRFDRFRDERGQLIFLCLKLHWVGFEQLLAKLQSKGHEILFQGPDYAFVGLNRPSAQSADLPASPLADTHFGAVRLNVQLPLERAGHSEPLLAAGQVGEGNLVYISYEKDHVRLGLDAGKRGGFLTPRLPVDFASPHVIEILHGSLFPPEAAAVPARRAFSPSVRNQLRLRLDGQLVLEATVSLPPLAPSEIVVGKSPSAAFSSSDLRFTGQIISSERVWPDDLTPFRRDGFWQAGDYGPLELTVRFPSRVGPLPEPLLTSGVAGAGDFIHVRYVDAGHVQIGYDHWGVRGLLGPILPLDYSIPHVVRIELGALLPPIGDPLYGEMLPDKISVLKQRVTVSIDGITALNEISESYETPPSLVRMGRNEIGGSTTSEVFTGEIMKTRRREFVGNPAPVRAKTSPQ